MIEQKNEEKKKTKKGQFPLVFKIYYNSRLKITRHIMGLIRYRAEKYFGENEIMKKTVLDTIINQKPLRSLRMITIQANYLKPKKTNMENLLNVCGDKEENNSGMDKDNL